MISKIWSNAVIGIDGVLIEIEVDISSGLPNVIIVGIPDVSVKESRERVKSAIKSIDFKFPVKRIVINLAPADIKKEGTIYDLPIALAILMASEQIPIIDINDFVFIGELSLDGRIKHVKGLLPMVIAAKEQGKANVVVPAENAKEAGIVEGINVFGMNHLRDVIRLFTMGEIIEPMHVDAKNIFKREAKHYLDFSDVKGQQFVKRALEIACAGAHNILLIGPPGSGKSMLAKRIPTILPKMSFDESLQSTKIHSIMGLVPKKKSFIATRPFRSPHHTISYAALVGGGSNVLPGEVSLAHNGVLFLDELPEFNRTALEVLRQPLEDKEVTIARAAKSITYPCNFMLVSAMNPCPCGYLGDKSKQCSCSSNQIQKYHSKVSGPLLDRIDIHIEVPAIKYKDMVSTDIQETSAIIRKRIDHTRKIQEKRFGSGSHISFNAHMGHKDIQKNCVVEEKGKKTLQMAIDELKFSARAYDKILKVSRTIADLDNKDIITDEYLLEAISYRQMDQDYFS